MEMNIENLPGKDELKISVTFTVPKGTAAKLCFADAEEVLAQKLALIGLESTKQLLLEHDSSGEALRCDGKTWSSKGQQPRVVESAYGPIAIRCHVYQTSAGGVTRVPLVERTELIGSATPKFAKMIASKLAQMPGGAVAKDMRENHAREMSKSFAQDLGEAVAALVSVDTARGSWQPLTKLEQVATIAVGVDGAHLPTRYDGWRQGMAGTIALYDRDGERLETCYIGGGPGITPPEGKAAFFQLMERYIGDLRQQLPQIPIIGLSDGAVDLQNFLEKHTDEHLLDFHHAAEYISLVAPAFMTKGKAQPADLEAWASQQRHALRDKPGAALSLLEKIRKRLNVPRKPKRTTQPPLTKAMREALEKASTYFSNNIRRMDYAGWTARKLPIGSGVTEAACKVLIKQRLSQSGMRWTVKAANALLSLRALYLTPSRWTKFWATHNSHSNSSL